jgi:hypothetical protein
MILIFSIFTFQSNPLNFKPFRMMLARRKKIKGKKKKKRKSYIFVVEIRVELGILVRGDDRTNLYKYITTYT